MVSVPQDIHQKLHKKYILHSISNPFMKHFFTKQISNLIWLETQPKDWICAPSFLSCSSCSPSSSNIFSMTSWLWLDVDWRIKICSTRVFKCVTRVSSISFFVDKALFSANSVSLPALLRLASFGDELVIPLIFALRRKNVPIVGLCLLHIELLYNIVVTDSVKERLLAITQNYR